MTAVGGCCPDEDEDEDEGACVRVVPWPKVGPEPASAAAKLFVILSISVVQGPALAELGIHDNSAKLVTMRIRGIITFSFSTSCSTSTPVPHPRSATFNQRNCRLLPHRHVWPRDEGWYVHAAISKLVVEFAVQYPNRPKRSKASGSALSLDTA
jgi:hypothetical protein